MCPPHVTCLSRLASIKCYARRKTQAQHWSELPDQQPPALTGHQAPNFAWACAWPAHGLERKKENETRTARGLSGVRENLTVAWHRQYPTQPSVEWDDHISQYTVYCTSELTRKNTQQQVPHQAANSDCKFQFETSWGRLSTAADTCKVPAAFSPHRCVKNSVEKPKTAGWRYQLPMQAAAAELDALKKHQERVRLLEVCQAELRALKPTRVR